jgi:hypothetical protein
LSGEGEGMKAILEFDLDSPEDQEKFKVASRSTEWYLVCLTLDKEIRDELKYRDGSQSLERIRARFHEIMTEYGVSLEDMS